MKLWQPEKATVPRGLELEKPPVQPSDGQSVYLRAGVLAWLVEERIGLAAS